MTLTYNTIPDLGTFEGFNFRHQAAIEQTLTAAEVLEWDHNARGEAEFWASGDNAVVAGIFGGNISASELIALIELLDRLGGDTDAQLLRIQFACVVLGSDIRSLTVEELDEHQPSIYYGPTLWDARKEAAFDLFETFWPDLYKAWNEDTAGVLRFDWEDFLDSPLWTTHETCVGDRKVLMVLPA